MKVFYEMDAGWAKKGDEWIDIFAAYVWQNDCDLDPSYPNECEWFVPGTVDPNV